MVDRPAFPHGSPGGPSSVAFAHRFPWAGLWPRRPGRGADRSGLILRKGTCQPQPEFRPGWLRRRETPSRIVNSREGHLGHPAPVNRAGASAAKGIPTLSPVADVRWSCCRQKALGSSSRCQQLTEARRFAHLAHQVLLAGRGTRSRSRVCPVTGEVRRIGPQSCW